MIKGNMKRFMAGLLCGVLLCMNTGIEQAVYAAPAAETAEEQESVKPEKQKSAKPEEQKSAEPAEQDPAEADDTEETGGKEDSASDEKIKEEPAENPGSGEAEDMSDNKEEENLQDLADTASEDIKGDFTVDQNGVLTAYTGSDTEIAIPDTVTEIGKEVFSGRTGLKNVTLPDGLKKIGDSAFKDCSALEHISIPDSVTSIGHGAFYNCSGLKGDLVIPDSVTEVKNYAFYGCSGFGGKLTLSENMTTVSPDTFNGCTGFTGTLEIPDNVVSIQSRAFYGWNKISAIEMGEHLTNIFSNTNSGYCAFENCTSVETITFTGTKVPVVNRSVEAPDSNVSCIETLFGSSIFPNLSTIFVPAGSYGDYALAYGDSLQDKTRIKTVEEAGAEGLVIEDHVLVAYTGDNEEVTVPADVKKIGNHAFLNNGTVKKVTLPEGLTEIGNSAFRGCTALKNVNLPDEVTSIGDYAFYNCSSLAGSPALPEDPDGSVGTFILPKSLASLGSYAFYNCSSLNGRLEIPAGVGEIKEHTFEGCSGLSGELVLPEGLTSIGEYAFYNCKGFTGSLRIPDSVEKAGQCAFSGCSGFNGTLTLSGKMETVAYETFEDCTGFMGTLTIPDSIKTLDRGAFDNCRKITKIVFGTGVTNICSSYSSGRTFGDCSGVETVTFLGLAVPVISSSVSATSSHKDYISDLFGSSCLLSLKTVYVPAGCYEAYSSAYGACLQAKTKIRETGAGDFIVKDDVLIAYMGDKTDVSIPENITEIGENAFLNDTGIESVVFPTGLTTIGRYAFCGCTGLKSITLPDSVNSIGEYAFFNCSSLSGGLYIPAGVGEIKAHTFEGCSGLSGELTLPEGLTSIGEYAFNNCKGFTGSLRIPDSVASIGSYAFQNCSGFNGTLTLSEKMETVAYETFDGCTGFIGTLTIPDSIKTLDRGAFDNCRKITEIVFGIGVTNICSSYSSGRTFGNCSGVETVTFLGSAVPVISSSVSATNSHKDYISDLFGSSCLSSLKTVYVPAGCYEAYSSAYGAYLQAKTKIRETGAGDFIVKDGVLIAYMGDKVDVKIPDTVTEIGENAFLNDTAIESVTFPTGLTAIGRYAFHGCTGLKGIALPDSVNSIGEYAFDNCSGLSGGLHIPAGVREIKERTFYGCSGLSGELILPEGLTSIGEYAFYNCKGFTGSLRIPDSVVSIGSYAFQNCSGFIGTLTLSKKMETVAYETFYGCTGFMGTLTIPDSIKTLDRGAFYNCKRITEIVFGSGVTNICSSYSSVRTFGNCSGVETVTFLGSAVPVISSSVSATSSHKDYISDLFGSSCFSSLTTVYVPAGCYEAYSLAYGACLQAKTRIRETGAEDFIIKDGVLIAYMGEETDVPIPENITAIGENAFLNNTEIENVTFPAGLTAIESAAFRGCTALKGIVIPDSVNSIGDYAFYNCCSLKGGLHIPDGVEEIKERTFYGCSGLSGELILPTGLTGIGEYAFYNCKGFTGSLRIPDSVVSIGSYAFQSCSGFDGTLTLSEKMETVTYGTFSGCSGFTGTLTIPDSIKTLDREAFYYCKGISEVIFGTGVKNIYSNAYNNLVAFGSCSGVERVTFLGPAVPVINNSVSATKSDYISDLFGSRGFSALTTIYTLPEYLAAYENAWRSHVPEKVVFSSDTMNLHVSNLTAEYVRSHSAGLKWTKSVNERVTGYYIYRDDVCIDDTADPFWEDRDLSPDIEYTYKVTGHTASGDETAAAFLTVTPRLPVVAKIYTDHSSNKVGRTDSYLYAQVRDSGNLKSGTGSFYYTGEDGRKVRIGTDLTQYDKTSKDSAVFKILWDITAVTPGEYTILFEFTDADKEKGSCSGTVIYDDSRPEALSGVMAVGGTNQIVLSWPEAHEMDTAKYHIYRRGENEDEFTLLKKIYGRDTLTYTDTKAAVDQKYYYYVVGVNSFAQEGEPSNIAVAVPKTDTEAPRVVQLTPANGSVIGGIAELYARAWDAVAVVKTELYLSLDKGETWTQLKSMKGDFCRFQMSTAEYADTEIYVKGMAYDAAGNVSTGLVYHYKIDNTGPEQVTGLSYESTATTVTLRWNDVKDQDFSFFRVEEPAPAGPPRIVQDVYRTLGVNIYNLKSDTEYRYQVTAYDQLGNRGEPSKIITVRTLKDTAAPVITKMSPEADYYNESIDVKITASDNTGVASMQIQTSPDAAVWTDYETVTFDIKRQEETASRTIMLDGFREGSLYIRGIACDIEGNKSDTSDRAPYVQYIIDRTPPAAPEGLRADAVTGAVGLSWTQGTEEDLDGYILYRSAEDGAYVRLADGLYVLNYQDRSVEKNTVYSYKLAARDRAGNISEAAGPVQGTLPEDTAAPEILSYAPADESTIGVSNRTFRLMVSDNWKLDRVLITYTVNDGTDVKTLLDEEKIGDYYKVVSAVLPTAELKDGDVLRLTVSVTDAQGLRTTESISYVADLTAPRVNQVSAKGDTEKITVSWTGNGEEDLAGYRIYRKADTGSYAMLAQRSAEGSSYEYHDYSADPGQTYYYKVEAVDRYGNTHAKESGAVWLTVEPTVTAALACDAVMKEKTEYLFDASASCADLGIVSWHFDFGDGEELSGKNAKAVHRYEKAGTYTVTLTVSDAAGKEAAVQKDITVIEEQMLGTVTVKAVDANGQALSDMPVYFDLDNTSENVQYTDARGRATFIAEAGLYAVGAYKDGFLPVKQSVIVRANTETDLELTVIEEPIVTGDFEVHRMTLDEIIAAGIDVADPANQQIVKITLRLTYGNRPVTMHIMTNGHTIYSDETVIVNTDNGTRKLTPSVVDVKGPASSGGTGGTGGAGSTGGMGSIDRADNVLIAILDVPVEASCLKEFFDVKLHIMNHADEMFELTRNEVTLKVPDGMTLVETVNTGSLNTVSFDSLKGQEEKTLNWTLRGDIAGEYDLEAVYTAVLDQFNAPVEAVFKTEAPIKVYGLDSLKLIVDIDKYILDGAFYFNMSLENKGETDLYLPAMNIMDNVIDVYEYPASETPGGEPVKPEVTLLKTLLQKAEEEPEELDPDAVLRTLSPEYRYTKKYICRDSITTDSFAALRRAVYEIAGGLGIEVEVNVKSIGDEPTHGILVADDDREPIMDAVVKVDDVEYKSDVDGTVKVTELGFRTVEVSAPGRQTRKFRYTLDEGRVRTFFLPKDDTQGRPYFTMIENVAWEEDFLTQRQYYTEGAETEVTLEISANWRGKTPGRYVFYQTDKNGRTVKRKEGSGGTITLKPGKDFKPRLKVKAILYAADGTASKPIDTGIEISKKWVPIDTPETPDLDEMTSFTLMPDVDAEITDDKLREVLPASWSLRMGKLPVDMERTDEEDGTYSYKVLIGFKDDEHVKNVETGWEEFKDNIEEARTCKDRRQKILDEYNDALDSVTYDFQVSVKFKAMGYAEVTFNAAGDLVKSEGGLLLEMSKSVKIGQTFLAGPVPFYLELELGMKMENSIALAYTPEEKLHMAGSLEFTIPDIKVGGGLGVSGVAQAGVEGSGGIKIQVVPNFTGDLDMSLAIKIKLLFFVDYEWEIAHRPPTHLWGKEKGRSITSYALNHMSEGNLSLTSDEYASEKADWNAAGPVLQEWVMPGTMPELFTAGGKRLMLFQTNINGMARLVYSVYENGGWSGPRTVSEIETDDLYYAAAVSEDSLCVVWQKLSGPVDKDNMDAGTLLQKMAESSEIYAAKWNGDGFGEAVRLTENTSMDMLPKLAVHNGSVTAAWVTNADHAVLEESDYTINCATCTDGQWSAASELLKGHGSVTELSVGYCGDLLTAVYMEDDKIRSSAGGGASLAQDGLVNGLQFTGKEFLWNTDGVLCSYTPSGGMVKFTDGTAAVGANYRVLRTGSRTAAVWMENESGRSVIYASMLTGDHWSDAIELFDFDGYSLMFYDVELSGEGVWSVIADAVSGADREEKTSLLFKEREPVRDIKLDYAFADEFGYKDNVQPVDIAVTNLGEDTVESFHVSVTKADKTVLYEQSHACRIEPGARECFTLDVDASEITGETELTVYVDAGSECDYKNNSFSAVTGRVDADIELEYYYSGDSVLIDAVVTNNSRIGANAVLSITEDDKSGKVLETAELGTVVYGEEIRHTFSVDISDLDFRGASAKYYVFTVSSRENDYNSQNNSAIGIIYNDEYESGGDDPVQEDTVSVTFDLQGHGTSPEDYAGYTGIEPGSRISRPTDPEAEGYVFTGWYKDAGCTALWDFENDTVQADLVLYAGWKEEQKEKPPEIPEEKVTVNVTFDLQGHGKAPEDYAGCTKVEAGSRISRPTDPEAESYVFTGWYKDAGCTVLWDFENDTIQTDLVLYAGWKEEQKEKPPEIPEEKVTVNVTFDLQGHGKAPEDYAGYTKVEAGSRISRPPDPKAGGYVFTGWYKDAGCTALWDFENDTAETDMILYAGWEIDYDYDGILEDDMPADGNTQGLWIAGEKSYTYTGAVIKPDVRVYYNEKRLKVGRDYTLSYKNNKAAGGSGKKAPQIIVKGRGNYAGTLKETFEIEQAELDVSCMVASDSYPKGKAYTPSVMLDGNMLKAKTDYTLTYHRAEDDSLLKKRPTTPGSYFMRVVGKGSCKGTFDFPFIVSEQGAAGISKGKASVGSMDYRGGYPDVSLSVGGKKLTYDTDYTVRFSNTDTAGTAMAVFLGKGNYTGTLKKTFKVRPIVLKAENISMAGPVACEKGGAQPEVTVTVGGEKLIEGTDYTVSYKGNTKVTKNAKAVIKGKGNYSGSRTVIFEIVPGDLNAEGVRIFVSDTAPGGKPAVTVFDTNGKKLSSGSDYTAEMDRDAHTVTIVGGKNGLYTADPPVVCEYQELDADKVITSAALNKRAEDFPKKFEYTENGVELDKEWLTVKAGSHTLSSDEFEIIGYISNVQKGTAAVVVQGTGEYGGTKILNFKIQSRSLPSAVRWITSLLSGREVILDPASTVSWT